MKVWHIVFLGFLGFVGGGIFLAPRFMKRIKSEELIPVGQDQLTTKKKNQFTIILVLLQLIPGILFFSVDAVIKARFNTLINVSVMLAVWISSILLARKIKFPKNNAWGLFLIFLIYGFYIAIVLRSFCLFALYVK